MNCSYSQSFVRALNTVNPILFAVMVMGMLLLFSLLHVPAIGGHLRLHAADPGRSSSRHA
jgi:hypothetical protein